jgi:hypothetical protein
MVDRQEKSAATRVARKKNKIPEGFFVFTRHS